MKLQQQEMQHKIQVQSEQTKDDLWKLKKYKGVVSRVNKEQSR
jgi:hypothetical protein